MKTAKTATAARRAAPARSDPCARAVVRHGRRMTAHRQRVYDTLCARRDHPTAGELFLRVRRRLPAISLATVYNCLDTLVACGMVKHVTCDRGPARFCPNLEEHAHFFCDRCGTILDVPKRSGAPAGDGWRLPAGAVVAHEEAAFHGVCPACAGRPAAAAGPGRPHLHPGPRPLQPETRSAARSPAARQEYGARNQ